RSRTCPCSAYTTLFRSMKLNDLAGLLSAEGGGTAAAEITGVTSDSRKVVPGMVFVAIAGSKADGASYAADAARRGASAIVAAKRSEEHTSELQSRENLV